MTGLEALFRAIQKADNVHFDCDIHELPPEYWQQVFDLRSFLLPLAPDDAAELALMRQECDRRGLVWEQYETDYGRRYRSDVDGRVITGECKFLFAPPGESWRIPAYRALHRFFPPERWSDAAQSFLSSLMGVPDAEIAARELRRREESIAWGCATLYLLISVDDAGHFETLGRRAFPSALPDDAVCVLPHRDVVVDRESDVAAQLLQPDADVRLLRAGLDWSLIHAAPRQRHDHISLITLQGVEPCALNDALRARIQVFGAEGWQA